MTTCDIDYLPHVCFYVMKYAGIYLFNSWILKASSNRKYVFKSIFDNQKSKNSNEHHSFVPHSQCHNFSFEFKFMFFSDFRLATTFKQKI